MKRSSILVLIIFVALLPLVSCEDDDSSDESSEDVEDVQDVEITSTITNTIDIPFSSPIALEKITIEPSTAILKSQADLDSFPFYNIPLSEPPDVDFSSEMVLAIFGISPPEGDRIFSIRHISFDGEKMRVYYWNRIVVGAFSLFGTHAYIAVKVARFDGPVQFIEDNNLP